MIQQTLLFETYRKWSVSPNIETGSLPSAVDLGSRVQLYPAASD